MFLIKSIDISDIVSLNPFIKSNYDLQFNFFTFCFHKENNVSIGFNYGEYGGPMNISNLSLKGIKFLVLWEDNPSAYITYYSGFFLMYSFLFINIIRNPRNSS